jgi:hypothetical protein
VRDYGNVPAPLFDFFRIDPLGNIVDKDALKGSLAACSTVSSGRTIMFL